MAQRHSRKLNGGFALASQRYLPINGLAIRAGTAALLALVVPIASSGSTLHLAEAMAAARENAHEVAAAAARVEAGEAQLRQARSYRLPVVSLQEIWMRTDSPAEAFALQLNQKRFSFPAFVASDPNNPDDLTAATTRFEVSLPLYTGGELSGRIEQAEFAAEAARWRQRAAGDAAALAAAEAYIRVAQAREHVQLLERSLDTVDAHVALAGAYVEQGMLVRSELLRAQVERARVGDLLAEAHGMARVAAANLIFRLNDGETEPRTLDPLPAPRPLTVDLADWQAGAQERPDLVAARQMLASGAIEAKVRRSGRLPKIGLVARRDFVDDSLFGSHGDSTALMAVGRIELWSGGRHRAAAASATAEYEAAAQEIDQFTAAVALEVRQAFEQARTARDRHRTAVEALEAAAEAERIAEERFRQGVVKMIDLLDVTTARREAETRELVARADAHLTHMTLATKAGRRPESALAETRTDTEDATDAEVPNR